MDDARRVAPQSQPFVGAGVEPLGPRGEVEHVIATMGIGSHQLGTGRVGSRVGAAEDRAPLGGLALGLGSIDVRDHEASVGG